MYQTNLKILACRTNIMIDSVFIGTRLEALEALQRYTNIGMIVTKEDSWVFNKFNNSKVKVLLVNKMDKSEIFDLISNIKTDLVLSAGFPYILPKYVLQNDAVFLNSHPAY